MRTPAIITMEEPAQNSPIGLCVLCGLPGAGKSTLARQLGGRHSPFPVVILSYDDVMADVAFKEESAHEYRDVLCQGGRDTSPWKQQRQDLLQCLECLVISLITSSPLKPPDGKKNESWDRFVQCLENQGFICAGGDSGSGCFSMNIKSSPVYVILDDNFYYQSMRYEVFQLTHSLGFCQLYLHCPVDCCLLRNNKRENRVMDRTITLMDSKLEKPNPEKNMWEKYSLFLDSSNGISMDEIGTSITSLMSQALENPVMPMEDDSEEKERDRDICAANAIHQADQNLRRLISEAMQTVRGLVSAKDIKQIAQDLQQVKSKALDQLRQSVTGKTVQDPVTDIISSVQSFRKEVDCILQQYMHKVQADSPTTPATVS
ncbi:L-seryl-tRNA(Sec) kinase isoform X2 [Dendropsophus ebraccatus]|uniref:L-seryl-tRNA(Sec) kinase isoform X2 n=1 Tax=Dendropsophus ebraccatus TaxID=150705 RepID=UPI0038311C82